ncbi:hypothetical protein HOLleu_39405 [Holothuria leucospilota]|uniref:Uncharacterized protein n=1 Tax=Holothuria leucospilota TaxID=206669 RepID=A0A9Q0YIB6_HOLLE|nr:hypothetical protein HOLleu_39405 [Holothuria leucospilota]
MSWTLAKDLERRGAEFDIVNKLLNQHASIEYKPDSSLGEMSKEDLLGEPRQGEKEQEK